MLKSVQEHHHFLAALPKGKAMAVVKSGFDFFFSPKANI